jgi:hypothetical protein
VHIVYVCPISRVDWKFVLNSKEECTLPKIFKENNIPKNEWEETVKNEQQNLQKDTVAEANRTPMMIKIETKYCK